MTTSMRTRRLTLDLSPWELFRALAGKERPFFIDAAQPWGEEWISSMGFRPRMQLRVAAQDALDPLAAIDGMLGRARRTDRTARIPFAGGVVVGLAYEAKSAIEPRACGRTTVNAVHLSAASYDAVVAYDHRRREYAVASWQLGDTELARFAEEVCDAAADHGARVTRPPEVAGAATHHQDAAVVASDLDAEAFGARVERIREYIAAGDVYQVNLSLELRAPLVDSPLDVYERLRALQPVPFGGYFDLGDVRVLSNSPELFLRRRGARVETCPIKGTRPRGASRHDDLRLAAELRADAKERAEHVMIVDLERNDLGRVCRTGSVEVTAFADVHAFRTVQHLVSTVRGTLRADIDVADLLRATFPGGSITGAPKIRAMQIIDEVETGARGFYTGALGWIDASGDLDLNVAIRTAEARGGAVTHRVGSGIVADSRPECEYAESMLKASAFLRAVAGDEVTTPDRMSAPARHAS